MNSSPRRIPDHARLVVRSTCVLLVQPLLALVATTAFAAGGGEGHDATMETIWQAVNLALVLGVIVYFGRKPIADFFATRRTAIQTDLGQAAELLAKAEQRNAELQRRLVDLSSEVEDIREAATRRAEQEAERILSDARAAAERIRRDAQAAVDQELRRAQKKLREEAADLAVELAASKLREQVGSSDRERLIDEFITHVEPSAGGPVAGGANR